MFHIGLLIYSCVHLVHSLETLASAQLVLCIKQYVHEMRNESCFVWWNCLNLQIRREENPPKCSQLSRASGMIYLWVNVRLTMIPEQSNPPVDQCKTLVFGPALL